MKIYNFRSFRLSSTVNVLDNEDFSEQILSPELFHQLQDTLCIHIWMWSIDMQMEDSTMRSLNGMLMGPNENKIHYTEHNVYS